MKIICITALVVPLYTFIGYTQYLFKTTTGYVQYSPLNKWQLAANSLVGYSHTSSLSSNLVPSQFRYIHNIVNITLDSLRHIPNKESSKTAAFFLSSNGSPLKLYMKKLHPRDSSNNDFLRWATVAPMYAKYGRYLIKNHLNLYIRYYLMNNFLLYFNPQTEFLSEYNAGHKVIDKAAVAWFGLKDNKIPFYSKDQRIYITKTISTLTGIIYLLFFISLIRFMWLIGHQKCNKYCKVIITWLFVIWLCNIGISTFSSPVILRHQAFPIIITLSLAYLIVTNSIPKAVAERE